MLTIPVVEERTSNFSTSNVKTLSNVNDGS